MNLFGLKVLRKLQLAGKLNLVGARDVNGAVIKFPIQGALGWEFVNDIEVWMSMLLDSLNRYFLAEPDKAFLDVGVNVGQTLVKYRSLYPQGKYIGFEPNPTCVSYVNQLVQVNRWEHLDIYPVGVAEKAGLCELNFFHGSEVDSTASIVADFRPDQPIRRRSHIALFPLDEFHLKHPISFVKIDVEGAELEVLRGTQSILSNDRPLVSTEILPCYDESNTFRLERQKSIETLMRDLEYWCYRIKKSNTGADEFCGLEELDTIEVHGDLSLSDYLWVPAEKAETITTYVTEYVRIKGKR